MKKSVLLLALLRCSIGSGLSQGIVSFNNNGIVAGNPDYILVHNIDASPLVGTNWVAQLYYGALGSPERSLIPVTNAPAHFRQPTTSFPGIWSGGTRTLLGIPEGDRVALQVKAWDRALFPSYETAFGAGGITGKSIIFDYINCGWCGPPSVYTMFNFQGFTLVAPMPLLSVTLSQNQNQLVLSWPTNFVGFTLQSSPAPGPAAHWTDSPNSPVIAGNQYLAVTIASNTAQFYRLKK